MDGLHPRLKHGIALKLLGVSAGAVLAIGVIGFWFGQSTPDSPLNRLNAILLREELADALFLYQQGNINMLYTLEEGVYEPVNIGTTLSTLYLSRRGEHLASLQLNDRGAYEVRADTQFRYSSDSVKTSAAVSPNGTKVAFAQVEQNAVKAAIDTQAGGYATEIVVLDNANVPIVLGAGFSPFFLDDDHLAWFSEPGLMLHNLRTGSTTLLSDEVQAPLPPYPSPAVARDGHVIAWAEPSTGMIHIATVSSARVSITTSYEGIGSPNIALGADALYVFTHTKHGTTISRHLLTGDPQGRRVFGIPELGRIIQLVP